MKPFNFTPEAARDLNRIWEFVAQESIPAADRVINAIERGIMRLARNPYIGHRKLDLADSRHRFYLIFSFYIVYRPGTRPIQIIRILHSARNVRRILETISA